MGGLWPLLRMGSNMHQTTKIYVAGHNGMVGSAIVRALKRQGYSNILTRARADLDLADTQAVESFFQAERPETVILAAAKVGGILANDTYPVEFLTENLRLQNNVLESAHRADVNRLLFLGSSCIYPKLASQPIREDSLLTGPLEPTNEAYAIAKIAGVKLCEYLRREYGRSYISAMPTNLYGPNDNYNLQGSHVLPALIRKYHAAKVSAEPSVTLWGTGSPLREFLHAADLAEACLFLLDHYDEPGPINIGTGEEVSIRNLAEIVQRVVGYTGETKWDMSKPDGTPRKLLDSTRLHTLGWRHQIGLEEGIRRVYDEVDKAGW